MIKDIYIMIEKPEEIINPHGVVEYRYSVYDKDGKDVESDNIETQVAVFLIDMANSLLKSSIRGEKEE